MLTVIYHCLALCLIADLGQDDFKGRVQAQNRLLSMADRCIPELLQAKQDEDLEVSRRVTWVLEQFPRTILGSKEIYPWLDSLPDGYPNRGEIVHFWTERWRGSCYGFSGEYPEYRSYRAATELWVQDLLYHQHYSASKVRRILRLMSEADQELAYHPGGRSPSTQVISDDLSMSPP